MLMRKLKSIRSSHVIIASFSLLLGGLVGTLTTTIIIGRGWTPDWIAWILLATLIAVMWYAWEARRQVEATNKAIRNSLHPILDILRSSDTDNPESLSPRPPINFYDSADAPMLRFQVHNMGNGPAINIFCLIKDGTGSVLVPVEQASLSPLASRQWSETRAVLRAGEASKISNIELNYCDVFGEQHETLLSVVLDKNSYGPSAYFEVKKREHKCGLQKLLTA